jgi:hypothetical protein
MRGNAVARAPGAPDFDLDIFFLVTRAIFYVCFAYRDNTRSHYISEYEFLTGETKGNRNSGNLPFWGRDTKRNLPPKKLNWCRRVACHTPKLELGYDRAPDFRESVEFYYCMNLCAIASTRDVLVLSRMRARARERLSLIHTVNITWFLH